MSNQVSEDKYSGIEITLQGAQSCISVGKGVIRALGSPSHISLKISDVHGAISIFPCDEDNIMAFRVPGRLLLDHRCVMRINSKRFVHGIMKINGLDTTQTYTLSGEYLEDKNIAVFSLVEGITHRNQRRTATVVRQKVRDHS